MRYNKILFRQAFYKFTFFTGKTLYQVITNGQSFSHLPVYRTVVDLSGFADSFPFVVEEAFVVKASSVASKFEITLCCFKT